MSRQGNHDQKPENISRWLQGLRNGELKSYETLRGWSLTALYFTLAVWALMLCYACYQFWSYLLEQSSGSLILPLSIVLSSLATFLLSARAGNIFLQAMRSGRKLPKVALSPFLAIATTIVLAGRAFAGA